MDRYNVCIVIRPVRGGFVVDYPTMVDGDEHPHVVSEVATTSGKAMRIAKKAVEEFSLVTKTKDETDE